MAQMTTHRQQRTRSIQTAAGRRPPSGGSRHRATARTPTARIVEAAVALGVPGEPGERFEAYAAKRWGKGWKLAAGGRKRASDEVSAFAADATGFQEKVAGELDVFS